MLGAVSDIGMAAWLRAAEQSGDPVYTFGPSGFEAYARLRYIADPLTADQSEADVRLPADHLSDLEQSTRALRVMAHFTTTPEHCFFTVWVGDLSNRTLNRWGGLPHLVLRDRTYLLLQGSVEDIGIVGQFLGEHFSRPPAHIWPADKSWCFASDVDPHWAGIGGGSRMVDVLLTEAKLDVVPAAPDQQQPDYCG